MHIFNYFQKYWNKSSFKKYKIGDEIEFIHKINSIPNRFKGTIEEINNNSLFPYCIKLSDSFNYQGYTVNYINIDKKQIL